MSSDHTNNPNPAPIEVTGSHLAVAKEMLIMAAPTVATMTSYTLMQFVDGWMVSQITPADPVYLTAQGNGSVWSFAPTSFFMGLVGVVNTYVAQNLGAGTPRNGAAYAWNAIWLALALWASVLLPATLVVPHVFAAMHASSPQLVELETAYAQILLMGGIFTMTSRSIAQYFYGMHRPSITLVGALAGNLTNLVFNYLLIYGNFGFPTLGVKGAAIATVIGSFVEMIIPLTIFLSAKYNTLYSTRAAWKPDLHRIREIIKLGWPAAVMFGNELICWAIFMTYYAGHFGVNHNNAGWIVLRYMHLSFMPAVGLSYACTAIVGKCLGAGRPDLVPRRAALGVTMAMIYMGLCALAFVIFREDLVRVFVSNELLKSKPDAAADVIAIAAGLMIIAALFQIFDGLGITLVGVLRGAGDTVWPGVVTIILSWVCILGLGAGLTFLVPQWELKSKGPWIAAAVYIILLGLALAWRFKSGAWKKIKVIDRPICAGH
ncbi:MAG: MATE family efflux transporter [Phycisphaerales bacterium]|nr:MATE family efflux transporter [Phycisphaerales bacterium]